MTTLKQLLAASDKIDSNIAESRQVKIAEAVKPIVKAKAKTKKN